VADAGTHVSPAGEWLLDNFHVVDEHIGEVPNTLYRIMVEQPSGVARAGPELLLDGRPLAGAALPLVDDGGTHDVVVRPRR
jgi:hypothetical protein